MRPRPPAAKAGASGEGEEKISTRVSRQRGPRELSDPKAMRALAHPTRLALLEALAREGPLTATEAAALLDDSPGNMSWHFSTLAQHGYVEEVPGKGRRRPWRLVMLSSRFNTTSDSEPAVSDAGTALLAALLEHAVAQLREWQARRYTVDPSWQQAGFNTKILAFLTPEELSELGDEVTAVLRRYQDRTEDRALRPAEAQPVTLIAWGHPLPPLPSGS